MFMAQSYGCPRSRLFNEFLRTQVWMPNGIDREWLSKATLTVSPRTNSQYAADGERKSTDSHYRFLS